MMDTLPFSEPHARASLSRARVLVVDDVPSNLIALNALLSELNCEVVNASSGAEALELAAVADFALILLDVMMPTLDGFGTLERLRLVPAARSTPVILLTAMSPERSTLERAYAVGAVDFISKPVEPSILLGKARAFLALYEQGREIRRQSEALHAKDRYLGVLAHDLRTPLAVVTMTAVQLSQSPETSTQTAGARLARAAFRMQSLSDDLLETARLALGSLRFRAEMFDMRELLLELLSDFEALYPRLRFEISLPDALPVTGDRLRLQQAVSNLMTNAVKYGTGWIGVRSERTSTHLRILFVNHSKAHTPAEIESLFAPFAQGVARGGGVGLGLYIVREIARLHGGGASAVWADGTITFMLELSLQPRTVAEMTAAIRDAQDVPVVPRALV
jgi:signal transduction histidine kinase